MRLGAPPRWFVALAWLCGVLACIADVAYALVLEDYSTSQAGKGLDAGEWFGVGLVAVLALAIPYALQCWRERCAPSATDER